MRIRHLLSEHKPLVSPVYLQRMMLFATLISLGFSIFYGFTNRLALMQMTGMAGTAFLLTFAMTYIGRMQIAMHLSAAIATIAILTGIHLQAEAAVWLPVVIIALFLFMQEAAYPWVTMIFLGTLTLFILDPLPSGYPLDLQIGTLAGQIACAAIAILFIRHNRTHHEERLNTAQLLAKEQAEKEKLTTIQTIAAGLAHLINNAMHVIHGSAFLLREPGPEESANKLIGMIEHKAEETSALARKLLYCADHMALEMQSMDLGSLIRTWLEDLRSLEQNMTVIPRARLPDHPVRCAMDTTLMREVLSELWNNAREACDPSSARISISLEKQDDVCVLQFRDNGHGIDPDNLSRVFEPFYSTRFLGRGLGLAAVRGIILLHHGTIDISSREGEGCTVSIRLPGIRTQPGRLEAPGHHEEAKQEPCLVK